MQAQVPQKTVLRTVGAYAGAAGLCVAILTCVLRLWRMDFTMPLVYLVDALAGLSFVKGTIESGWYWVNPALGAPGIGEMFDYPMVETLHYGIMKLLSFLWPNYAVVANLYFLLTFPLTTLTSLWVLRRFAISWGPAILVSVLYAFLPYHFDRGLNHLFLAAYYLIPPATLVMYWLYHDQRVLLHRDGQDGRLHLRLLSFESIASVAICVLVSLAGVYYAAFTGFFLVVAGAAAGFARRRLYPLATAGILCGLTVVSLGINLLPVYQYVQANGPNPEGLKRSPDETEAYGLKIAHLLMPGDGHRLQNVHLFFSHRISTFGVYLGLIGGAGFVALVARFIFRGRGTGQRSGVLNALCLLNGCGVLLATVCGFSYVFSWLVTPTIRCYYRMAIFLGFFALVAVAVGLDRLGRRLGGGWLGRGAFYALLAGLLGFGLVDQVPKPVVRYSSLYCKRFHEDVAIVAAIEASLPAGAMIFQLPYSPWPEPATKCFGFPYEGLRPYLHSKHLHWSYGAYRGREWDQWQKRVSALPVDAMVRQVALAGFGAIYLDKNCRRDQGTALEAALLRILGPERVCSPDGKRSCFALRDYVARLKQQVPSSAWDALHQAALYPVRAQWGAGFSYLEEIVEDSFRWCASSGELHLINKLAFPRTVALDMEFTIMQAHPANLWVESEWFKVRLDLEPNKRTPLKRMVTVPPGKHTLHFRCDAPRLRIPAPRVMVFQLHNFSLSDSTPEEWPGLAQVRAGNVSQK
jgi:phosphoglycerol transferase